MTGAWHERPVARAVPSCSCPRADMGTRVTVVSLDSEQQQSAQKRTGLSRRWYMGARCRRQLLLASRPMLTRRRFSRSATLVSGGGTRSSIARAPEKSGRIGLITWRGDARYLNSSFLTSVLCNQRLARVRAFLAHNGRTNTVMDRTKNTGRTERIARTACELPDGKTCPRCRDGV